MYSLNQEKPWYLSDEWYVTVEEFDAIRRMNFPKDFIDFFEIAFRTGLHEKDILNLKKDIGLQSSRLRSYNSCKR